MEKDGADGGGEIGRHDGGLILGIRHFLTSQIRGYPEKENGNLKNLALTQ